MSKTLPRIVVQLKSDKEKRQVDRIAKESGKGVSTLVRELFLLEDPPMGRPAKKRAAKS